MFSLMNWDKWYFMYAYYNVYVNESFENFISSQVNKMAAMDKIWWEIELFWKICVASCFYNIIWLTRNGLHIHQTFHGGRPENIFIFCIKQQGKKSRLLKCKNKDNLNFSSYITHKRLTCDVFIYNQITL